MRGRHHVLEVPEVVCRVGDRCSLRLRLVADEGWTVNADYPTKFIAEPTPFVDFERENRKFSRSDVMMDSVTAASLFVRFRASEPGQTLLRGAFKAAICKGDECTTFDDAVAARVTIEARAP